MPRPKRTFSLPTISPRRHTMRPNLRSMAPASPPTASSPLVTSREKSFVVSTSTSHSPIRTSSSKFNRRPIPDLKNSDIVNFDTKSSSASSLAVALKKSTSPATTNPGLLTMKLLEQQQPLHHLPDSQQHQKLYPRRRTPLPFRRTGSVSSSTDINYPTSTNITTTTATTTEIRSSTATATVKSKSKNNVAAVVIERHSLDEAGSTSGASASTHHVTKEELRHSSDSARHPPPEDALSDVSDSRLSDGRRRTSTSTTSVASRRPKPSSTSNSTITTTATNTSNTTTVNEQHRRQHSNRHYQYEGDTLSADRLSLGTSLSIATDPKRHQPRRLVPFDNQQVHQYTYRQQKENHKHDGMMSSSTITPSGQFTSSISHIAHSQSAAQLGHHHQKHSQQMFFDGSNVISAAAMKTKITPSVAPRKHTGLQNDSTGQSMYGGTASVEPGVRAMSPLSLTTEASLGGASSTYAPTSGTNPTMSSATAATSTIESVRRPIMYFAKFGSPSTWALDVFSLPHNAIRSECVDLYNILESIHARSHRVCVVELEEFFTWWSAFEAFIIEYFDFEADVLYPWVFPLSSPSPLMGDGMAGLPDAAAHKANVDAVLRNSLLSKKDGLLDSIRQLNGTFELRRHVDTTDVFQTIVEEVNAFVPKLLEYLHTQERHLPPIAAQMYSPSSREVLAKKYVQYIKRGESPQMNLILLSKWMDSDTKDKWVKNNVKGYWRLLYRRLEKRCFKMHGMIAAKFKKRLQRSVRSCAASRLRRRTEFGEEIDELSFGSAPSYGGSVRSLSLAVGGGNSGISGGVGWGGVGGSKDVMGRQKSRTRKDIV